MSKENAAFADVETKKKATSSRPSPKSTKAVVARRLPDEEREQAKTASAKKAKDLCSLNTHETAPKKTPTKPTPTKELRSAKKVCDYDEADADVLKPVHKEPKSTAKLNVVKEMAKSEGPSNGKAISQVCGRGAY